MRNGRVGITHNPLRLGPPVIAAAADWHEHGIELERRGDIAAAIQSYRLALMTGGPDVQIAFDLAYALADSGQIGAAIERYQQVIELDATRQDAWVNLGDLLLTDGQVDAGIAALRHGLQLEPLDLIAHYNLADALDAIDRITAARHWRDYLRLASGPLEQIRYARHRLAEIAGS